MRPFPAVETTIRAAPATLPARHLGLLLSTLFVLSGLAGLLYQSIWTQYLGLLLGHAAYAQTLVLALFMGGMALGAALAARRLPRLRRLLRGYALVEALIGLLGLLFPLLHAGWTQLADGLLLPWLGGLGIGSGVHWLGGLLLIGPACVLLGATFPLLAGVWLRRPDNDAAEEARALGGLYFANSFGAAVGALIATFLLLPTIGLPGTVMTAGALNLLVALGAWQLARRLDEPAPLEPVVPPTRQTGAKGIARVVLWATAGSGAFSFVYEIGWIRLLNQALGTTLHSFELMLCAFILGLALGGLVVRRLAARIGNPLRWAGWAQVAMGAAALLSLIALANSFAAVGWMLQALARNDSGYLLYLAGSATLAILVMLPAAWFAGMTLPLFTLAWRREGGDEGAVGRVYAANTLGAIAGVLLAVHLLIPLLGVRSALLLAALGDIGIGLWLLQRSGSAAWRGMLLALPCLGLALLYGRIDPLAQASAVYRTGESRLAGAEVRHLQDGKTSTIAVVRRGSGLSILSNGKPDASLTALDDTPTGDESTMLMLAALPLALHPDPQRVAMIGWGSGLSAHALLGSARIGELHNIEIERAMVDSARLFGGRVARAYADTRSHLVVDDARSWFAGQPERFDVIVSEPSNPWVAGVASLFTVEFYRRLERSLDDDGLLVQWIQTYELDDALFASMLAALLEVFPDAELYSPGDGDTVIVARKRALAHPLPEAWDTPALRSELARVGLGEPRNLPFHRIGDAGLLRAFVAWQQQPPHRDRLPRVALAAPRARFTGQRSELLQELLVNGLPLLDLLGCRAAQPAPPWPWPDGKPGHVLRHGLADELVAGLRRGAASEALIGELPGYAASLEALLALSKRLDAGSLPLWSYELAVVAGASLGPLPAAQLEGSWIDPWWLDVASDGVSELPAEVAPVMAALQTAAQRDAAALTTAAQHVLDLDASRLSPLLREQMLKLAVVAAIASDAPRAQRDRLVASARSLSQQDQTSQFLLHVLRSGKPVCLARAP